MSEQIEKEKKEGSDRFFSSEKYIFTNIWVDLISYILISTVIIGSIKIYYKIDDILIEVKEYNPNFLFPTYVDLIPSVIYLLLLIFGHEIIIRIFSNKMERHLHPRYSDEVDHTLIDIYKKKITTNMYKFSFYLFSTIFGFYVLKDLDFFPWSLLGSGEFKNTFRPSYPEIFYFKKPELFDFYYNLNLSFALFDGYLLLSNPLQSDFLFMVLHHISTYSLIIFSFIVNYSNIGSIVCYIHYLGDVFSYIVRVGIHLNVPDAFPFVFTFLFLVVFSYTRLFVFGDALYQIIVGLRHPWTIIEWYLTGFLGVLMLLNILWIVLISKKFIKYCFTGNIEEIYKFKIKKKE